MEQEKKVGKLIITASVDSEAGLQVKFDAEGDYKFSITEIFGIIKVAELTHADYVKQLLQENKNQ